MSDAGTPLGGCVWSRWQAGVETAVCFIAACDYTDIDPRGPVFIRGQENLYYACTEHWEAIIGILGRQTDQDDAMHFFGAQGEHTDQPEPRAYEPSPTGRQDG